MTAISSASNEFSKKQGMENNLACVQKLEPGVALNLSWI